MVQAKTVSKQDKKEQPKSKGDDSALLQTLSENFSASRDAFIAWKETLDEKERHLYGKPRKTAQDQGSKANVNDPRLFSQTFERSNRVMSQLANGKFKGVSSDDIGKNLLMNLIVERYVIPNANSQFDFLTKLRLVDWYSLGYGSMIPLVDWVVKDDYVGPDLFMVPIRNIYPQPGVSWKDMDWCQVDTEVNKSFVKKCLKMQKRGIGGWKNIDRFLELTKDSTGFSPQDKTAEEMSLNDKIYNTAASNTKKFPRFRWITEYRRDRWITYAPDYQLVIREIANPQENNLLPLPVKYCIPLIDFCFGLSEVEISASLVDTINSTFNLAIDDAKMQLYPPMAIVPGDVVMSSIKLGPAQKWLLNERSSRMPEPFTMGNRGAQLAMDLRQALIGSQQSLAGTSDTTVKQGDEYSMGKTPKALGIQEARQSTRDEIDRFYMEQFITDVYRRFANMIVKKMPKEIILRLFKTEIEKIAQNYPDIMQLVDKKQFNGSFTEQGLQTFVNLLGRFVDNKIIGKYVKSFINYLNLMSGQNKSRKVDLTIPKDFFKGYQFDYDITPGSTFKIDQQTQAQNLQFILEMAQNKDIQAALQMTGKRLDIPETISRLLTNSGIADPDKLLVDEVDSMQANPEQLPPDQAMTDQIPPQQTVNPAVDQISPDQAAIAQAMAADQQVAAQQAGATPMPQVVNQVPVQMPTAPAMGAGRDPQIADMEAQINQRFQQGGI